MRRDHGHARVRLGQQAGQLAADVGDAAGAEVRAGADVGVVGFDDSAAAQVTWPGLSSVRQPLEDVAVALVETLHDVLGHRPVAEQGVMLEPRLVVRRSSQRGWRP